MRHGVHSIHLGKADPPALFYFTVRFAVSVFFTSDARASDERHMSHVGKHAGIAEQLTA
jgi:hypothetical protein